MRIARLLPRFQAAYRQAAELDARENWNRGQLAHFQLERLNRLWESARRNVAYYREQQRRLELPAFFESLEQFSALVPILRRETIADRRHDLLSEQAQRGSWKRTGGSSGQPLSVYWAKAAHLENLRCKYRFYAHWNLDIFHRTAFVWGHSGALAPGHTGFLYRLRQPIERRLRGRILLSAYRLGHEDLRSYLKRIGSFRPESLYGYPTALGLLAREAETTGFRCPTLKLIVCSGEPASQELIARIQSSFRAPVVVEYGSIECGVIASQLPDGCLYVRDDQYYLETLPARRGGFEIVVTVLNNPSFPLIRYAIGDLTPVPVVRPVKGFSHLAAIEGRKNDFIVSRSGRFVHSSRFDAFFKYECSNLRSFRIRQGERGDLLVDVVPNDSGVRFETGVIEERLRNLVEGFPVEVRECKTDPLTPAGKHRPVCSHLANRPHSDSIDSDRALEGIPRERNCPVGSLT